MPARQTRADGGEQLLDPRGAAGHPPGVDRPAAPARGAAVREQNFVRYLAIIFTIFLETEILYSSAVRMSHCHCP